MSCTGNVCGTGGWSGPLPGDPDNNVALAAVPASGGIDVTWSYPSTNAFAVSYVEVYRGLSNNFNAATKIASVAATFYFDKLPIVDSTQFFYWIRIVSINGTVGAPVGPASAYALPMIDAVLAAIGGRLKINSMAPELQSVFDKVPTLEQNIAQEISNRVSDNQVLSSAIDAVQSDTDQALTYVRQELINRKTENEALVSSINALSAGFGGDIAAALDNEITVRATADEAMATSIEALVARTDANEAAITTEQTTRTTALEALATDITGLLAKTDATNAAVQTEVTTRADATNALSDSLSALSTTVNGHTTTLQAQARSLDGVGAEYTVKVDNNGYVSGFGFISTSDSPMGQTSEFVVNAERFAVVKPGTTGVYPFTVGTVGGVTRTVINSAIIADASINSAKIGTAEIGTLHLNGAAVTVPLTSRSGQAHGSGYVDDREWAIANAQEINRGAIYLSDAGIVYAHCIASQWYPTAEVGSQLLLEIFDSNNVLLARSNQGGLAQVPSPVVATSVLCSPGWITVVIRYAAMASIYLTETNLFVMGAKR